MVGWSGGFAAVCGLPFVCGLGRLLEHWSQPCQSPINLDRLNNQHLRRQVLPAGIMDGQELRLLEQERRLLGQERHRMVGVSLRLGGSPPWSPDCSGGVLSIGRWLSG